MSKTIKILHGRAEIEKTHSNTVFDVHFPMPVSELELSRYTLHGIDSVFQAGSRKHTLTFQVAHMHAKNAIGLITESLKFYYLFKYNDKCEGDNIEQYFDGSMNDCAIKTGSTKEFDAAIDTAIARYEKLISVKEVIEEMRKKALENIDIGEHPNHASFAYQEGVLISNQQALDIYNACFQ